MFSILIIFNTQNYSGQTAIVEKIEGNIIEIEIGNYITTYKLDDFDKIGSLKYGDCIIIKGDKLIKDNERQRKITEKTDKQMKELWE